MHIHMAGLRASRSAPGGTASSDKANAGTLAPDQGSSNTPTSSTAVLTSSCRVAPLSSASPSTGSGTAAARGTAPPRGHRIGAPHSHMFRIRSCASPQTVPLQRFSPMARSSQSAAFPGGSSPAIVSGPSSPAGATNSETLFTTANSCFSSQQLFTVDSHAQLLSGAAALMPEAVFSSWDELSEPLAAARQGSSSFNSSTSTPYVSQLLQGHTNNSCYTVVAAPAGVTSATAAAAAAMATVWLPEDAGSSGLLPLVPWSPPSTGCEGWKAVTACSPSNRLVPICSGPVLQLSPTASYQEHDPSASLSTLLPLHANLADARAAAVSAGKVVQPAGAVDASAGLLGSNSCDILLSTGLGAPYGQQQQQVVVLSGSVLLDSPSGALTAVPAGAMMGTWPGGAMVGQLVSSTDGCQLTSNRSTGVEQQLVCLPALTNSLEPQQQLQLCGGQQVAGESGAAAAAAVAEAKLATIQQLEVLQQQLHSDVVTLLPLLWSAGGDEPGSTCDLSLATALEMEGTGCNCARASWLASTGMAHLRTCCVLAHLIVLVHAQ